MCKKACIWYEKVDDEYDDNGTRPGWNLVGSKATMYYLAVSSISKGKNFTNVKEGFVLYCFTDSQANNRKTHTLQVESASILEVFVS